jgi:hypothetical protein
MDSTGIGRSKRNASASQTAAHRVPKEHRGSATLHRQAEYTSAQAIPSGIMSMQSVGPPPGACQQPGFVLATGERSND